MKTLKSVVVLCAIALLFVQCQKDDDEVPKMMGMFKVVIENVMEDKMFFASGVFNTPVGASAPGGAGPGNSYEFSFNAGLGSKLSFATMFVKSNDLFYAPSGDGLSLYENDAPISGDITSHIMLWDAGTEVNQEPGTGSNQPLNGGGGVGPAENGMVKMISAINDGFTYPLVAENIKVSIFNDGASGFTVTIENLPGSSTPIAPGVWVVHSAAGALFTASQADGGMGLEELAEDGDPSVLGSYLDTNSGYVSPLAPGAWALHIGGMPLFSDGSSDFGEGLEDLAEDGNPATLSTSLQANTSVAYSGVFNTPSGASGAGPLLPGNAYEFTFQSEEGQYLSFATMLVHTNDLFFAPADMGIALWNGSSPISGDVTSSMYFWDAGTEVNEYPGAGIHQPARLNGGDDENSNVMMVNDGFMYPNVSDMIKVTITPM